MVIKNCKWNINTNFKTVKKNYQIKKVNISEIRNVKVGYVYMGEKERVIQRIVVRLFAAKQLKNKQGNISGSGLFVRQIIGQLYQECKAAITQHFLV